MKLRYPLLTTLCAFSLFGSCRNDVPYFTAPPAAPVFGGFTTLPQSERRSASGRSIRMETCGAVEPGWPAVRPDACELSRADRLSPTVAGSDP